MRVLITRPEREAVTLATALSQRGHVPVIAPLFRLEILHPPADFAASLAACQAVLLTSANGARALAEASEQRGRPILAVGDTTATTAEGLGFNAVTSASGDAAALAELVRQRLDPKGGPLLHVSGVDAAADLGEALGRAVSRCAASPSTTPARRARCPIRRGRRCRPARSMSRPSSRRARRRQFAKLVGEAGLADSVRDITAIAISPAALAPLGDLPFKATVAAARPTRQAVLDEIDRLAEAGVQGQAIMSDTPSSSPCRRQPGAAAATVVPIRSAAASASVGAFIIGLVAAVLVLAGAVISLPFWPEEARTLWRGQAARRRPHRRPASTCRRSRPPPTSSPMPRSTPPGATSTPASTISRSACARCRRRPPNDPPRSDPAIAELRAKVEALAGRADKRGARRRSRPPTGRQGDRRCCGPRSPPCTPPCRRSTRP